MDNNNFQVGKEIQKDIMTDEKKQAFLEMSKASNELSKHKRKKFLIIISIIVSIILIIKIFFGTIEINNIFGYPNQSTRFYKVTINDKLISSNYILRHTIPIIPFLVNINSFYLGTNYVTQSNGVNFISDGSDKYLIDIESYSCYTGEYQIRCNNEKSDMKKENDTKYSKMTIVRTNNPYEEVYNGPFINDITSYVSKKGVYAITITAKYSLIETEVYFYFIK